ncbi:regulatory protein RecX [Ferrimonas marina]|uniref:Regulatory protein RecX n=1 Tax=Ferrimonas marina TaxID=299255 RepID=A0A1M5ZTU2_9GAMM|nr:regulatory protein RecX [Ferrimonas marina]SHI27641.1 regulatory protein [Ferrimonas marina]
MSEKKPGQSALAAAVGLLSRRDHSRGELQQKLRLRGFSVDEIQAAVERVTELGYLDDARFAQLFVRYRSQGGKGPMRLRMELRERQVADELIRSALTQPEIDWFELCRDTRQRKFGEGPVADFKQRQKVQRYLAYRGFDMEQIRYALSEE